MTTTASTAATQQRIPERTNTAAMIGLLCSLLGLAPIGVVFGCIGADEIHRRSHETGARIAGAAVALGLIEILVVVVVLVMTFAN
ncbi:hypothetical protein [Prescottella agglutinans]|uniref:DUF4190 domain-containing protein n=1 Tax=Prescottella agglutinans TaxID=1644129 RepID=A0ABT6MLL7_9NOCA|nr:hypothetical protein [Prescottella agglutinans]MDH6284834.1 hypothetical protein [Prescottella agglutinans]